ncbi:MAG: hypothetical protein NTZ10_05380 [Candidatus Saganbacteria bacterium]|nr:hypothetical protein [Candidatus Saganbacteria bacterium]
MANLFKLTEFLSSKIDIQRLLKAGEVSGLFGTAKAAFLAAFSNTSSYDIVFAAKNADIAEQIYCEVKLFAEDGKQPVYFFSNDDLPENLAALFSMLSGEKSIIVTTQDALFKKTYKKDSLLDDTVRISKAERIDTEYLIKKLSGIGYERVFMVEDSGEFSVRGGIIDVFLKDRRAVRIEFSDDKAASIREFDTVTQRSIRLIENIEILPVREKKEEEFHKNMKNDTVILMDEAGSADARIKKPSGKTVLELNAFPRNEGAFNFECRFASEYRTVHRRS